VILKCISDTIGAPCKLEGRARKLKKKKKKNETIVVLRSMAILAVV
jgi:hypothetical protein